MLNTHWLWRWEMVFLCFRQLLDQQCSVVTRERDRQTLPQICKVPRSELISTLGTLIILQRHKQTR